MGLWLDRLRDFSRPWDGVGASWAWKRWMPMESIFQVLLRTLSVFWPCSFKSFGHAFKNSGVLWLLSLWPQLSLLYHSLSKPQTFTPSRRDFQFHGSRPIIFFDSPDDFASLHHCDIGCHWSYFRVSDGMIGGNHRSNAELVGQGVGNIMSALFVGFLQRVLLPVPQPTSKMADEHSSSGYGSCLHLAWFTFPHALRFIDSYDSVWPQSCDCRL